MDIARIRDMAQKMAEPATEMRRFLHTNPEPSWQEVETTRFIASELEETGFKDIKIGVEGKPVGLVADLKGKEDGPLVALRTDIDALSITEEGDLPYKSRRDGASHACGHDGHIAILLHTAKLLYSMKDEFSGGVRFIFQPAEEKGDHSGAPAMVKEGVLDGVGAVAGMHLWAHVPTGRVQWRAGPVMASVDGWEVKFFGQGGHGAMPQNAVDPTVTAANFILALQTVVSREVNPLETGVISVGKLVSGDVINIIPDRAEMIGNIRTFNPAVRDKMEAAFRRIAEGVAATYRCRAEIKYTTLYPPVINDSSLAELLRDTALQVVGENNVEESPMLMTSEDFSFYQMKVPGVLFFLGSGDEAKGTTAPHHSPKFNVDDTVLPTGISLMTAFALNMLEKLREGRSS